MISRSFKTFVNKLGSKGKHLLKVDIGFFWWHCFKKKKILKAIVCLQNPRHDKINMVLPKNISAKGCNSILFGVVITNRIISVVKPKPRNKWTWWKRYHILFRTTTIWYFSGFQFMLGVGLVNLRWTCAPSRGSQILSSAKHNRNNYWAFEP